MDVGGDEGFVNSSSISQKKIEFIVEHNLQLDCMWVITVQEGWKVKYPFMTPTFNIFN